MKSWTYNPNSGGTKISPKMHEEICQMVESFACTRPWYPDIQLKARFKGQFCYIDTIEQRDGEERVFPLSRLRRLNSGWSMALFTWSNERYSPCIFPSGQWEGSIEEALAVCDPMVI
jgi:hypothetical protein